jgi:hypothetical protein
MSYSDFPTPSYYRDYPKRHTMEIDFDEWLARARKERAAGAERAAAAGYRPEVATRARERVANPA